MKYPSRSGIKPTKNIPLFYDEAKHPRTFLLTNSIIDAIDSEIAQKSSPLSRSEFVEQLFRKRYKMPLP